MGEVVSKCILCTRGLIQIIGAVPEGGIQMLGAAPEGGIQMLGAVLEGGCQDRLG